MTLDLDQLKQKYGRVYATQGGGYAREIGESGTYIMVTDSKVPNIVAGDTVPDMWDLIPMGNYD